MSAVALGCRVHSGWAALVAVEGSPTKGELIDRRRIEIADPGIAGSKQPFHAAEPLPIQRATAFIDRCTKSTNQLATKALRGALDELKKQGHDAEAFGVVLGSGKPLPGLEAILRSHALIHTAEGEFFRQAMVHAGKACRLLVKGSKQRELMEICAGRYKLTVEELQAQMAAMGRAAGPPWTEDQKLATLAAWVALAAR